MRKIVYIVLFISTLACSTSRKVNFQDVKDLQSLDATSQILSTLASDQMEGRLPGTAGMEKAAKWVENELTKMGVKPFFDNSYRQYLNSRQYPYFNLVGVIEGKSDEYVLLGAHLDHLGKESGSQTDSVYNGANDNASGVTAVLQIAKVLKKYKFKKNIIIAFFTAEEMGLVGSEHLAQRLSEDSLNLKYVLNIDMIASPFKKGEEGLYISGYDRSNLHTEINKALKKDFLLPSESTGFFDVFYLSDNYPFYSKFNIPAHTFCTFNFKNYPAYHQLNDEVSQLDWNYFNNVIHNITYSVVQLLQNDTEIKLNTTE